jgi:hypothetical protein
MRRRKFEHIYKELFFRKVAYTRYDVPWFVEWVDFCKGSGKFFSPHTINIKIGTCIEHSFRDMYMNFVLYKLQYSESLDSGTI